MQTFYLSVRFDIISFEGWVEPTFFNGCYSSVEEATLALNHLLAQGYEEVMIPGSFVGDLVLFNVNDRLGNYQDSWNFSLESRSFVLDQPM